MVDETTIEAEAKKETVENYREKLSDVDSLADTPFSALFHEARTAGRRTTSVACQVRVRDGEVETSDPVPTRRGESLRGTDSWDAVFSLPAKAFMDVETAVAEIRRKLRQMAQQYGEAARKERERRKVESGEWSR